MRIPAEHSERDDLAASRRDVTVARRAAAGHLAEIRRDLTYVWDNYERIQLCADGLFEVAQQGVRSSKMRTRLAAGRACALYIQLVLETTKAIAALVEATLPGALDPTR
ncbi:MAG: hypothetical protein ABII12_13580 [Planctomycetota bacterium]